MRYYSPSFILFFIFVLPLAPFFLLFTYSVAPFHFFSNSFYVRMLCILFGIGAGADGDVDETVASSATIVPFLPFHQFYQGALTHSYHIFLYLIHSFFVCCGCCCCFCCGVRVFVVFYVVMPYVSIDIHI